MDFALPEIGEGVYEAELVRWLVKPGDAVKRGQNLDGSDDRQGRPWKCPRRSPAPSTRCGRSPAEDQGRRSRPDLHARRRNGPPTRSPRPAPPSRGVGRATPQRPRVAGAPVACRSRRRRRCARWPAKLGIDLGRVHGSGPEGRILIEDLPARVQAPAHEPRRRPPPPSRRPRITASPARASSCRAAPQDRRAHGPGQADASPTTPTSMNAT